MFLHFASSLITLSLLTYLKELKSSQKQVKGEGAGRLAGFRVGDGAKTPKSNFAGAWQLLRSSQW